MSRLIAKRRMKGQAMTEFIVVAGLVIVPLFIIVPMLGKYIDARHTTEQAARYAAWERTAWFASTPAHSPGSAVKTAAEIDQEIQDRFMGGSKASLHSGQKSQSSQEDLKQIYFAHDRNQGKYEHAPIFEEKGQSNGKVVYMESSVAQLGDEVSSIQNKTVSGINNLPLAFSGLDVNTNGLYKAEVSLDLKEPAWFKHTKRTLSDNFAATSTVDNDTDLRIDQHHVVMVDGWNSGGVDHNVAFSKGLLVTDGPLFNNGIMDAFDAARDVIAVIPKIGDDIGTDDLRFGHVDVEATPSHRLKNFGE